MAFVGREKLLDFALRVAPFATEGPHEIIAIGQKLPGTCLLKMNLYQGSSVAGTDGQQEKSNNQPGGQGQVTQNEATRWQIIHGRPPNRQNQAEPRASSAARRTRSRASASGASMIAPEARR